MKKLLLVACLLMISHGLGFAQSTITIGDTNIESAADNTVSGARTANLLGKHFSITESKKVEFRCDAFNAFNRANFSNPDATIGAATAGVISSTLPARSMQFALKFIF